jgi:hypothetical protein
VAIATPPGDGALGVVRVSGPDAVVIAAALLSAPTPLATQPSHTLRRVRLVDRETGTPIDEAQCAVMRAPPDAGTAELCTAITGRRAIVARSKSDLPTHPTAPGLGDALAVSSTTGAGLAALIARLGDEVMRIVGDDGDSRRRCARSKRSGGSPDRFTPRRPR